MAGLHDRLQSQCFLHLWNFYPESRHLCWHTPNELIPTPTLCVDPLKGETALSYIKRCKDEYMSTYVRKLSVMKAIGVLKGVVDLVFYWGGVLYLFDIKLENDRLSNDQKLFIQSVIAQGGRFDEINDLEQFKAICNFIFKR